MNNLEFLQVLQRIQKLDCESPNQVVIKSIEIIYFEEFKEVHAQQLKTNAQMLSEDHIVFHMNHIHYVIWVVFFKEV